MILLIFFRISYIINIWLNMEMCYFQNITFVDFLNTVNFPMESVRKKFMQLKLFTLFFHIWFLKFGSLESYVFESGSPYTIFTNIILLIIVNHSIKCENTGSLDLIQNLITLEGNFVFCNREAMNIKFSYTCFYIPSKNYPN